MLDKPLVLITGGAGFIGSHTADALLRSGYRVRILDSLDPQVHGPIEHFPKYLQPNVECIRGDVRDSEAVRLALDGVSYIYHFAALTGVGQSNYDLKKYVDVNVSGTANVVEVIVRHGFPIQRLILASSRAVYGEGTHCCPDHGIIAEAARSQSDLQAGRFEVYCAACGQKTYSVPTAENSVLSPISMYGWTKKLQEEQCQFAVKTFGLSVVMLRYFNVYGSRQSLVNPYTGILSIFFSRLMSAKPISIYEHGVQLRDFVHIVDVVDANIKALNPNVSSGAIINVGTGIETSVFEIARGLARAMGKEPQFEDRGEFRVGDIHSCVADLCQARKLLQYHPKTSLDEGIREVVAWAQQHPTEDLYEQAVSELQTFGLFGRARSQKSS